MSPDMIPFLFEKLAMPVGIVIPIGAFFLTFLLAYGLLESIGTLMEPVMRPIFKTPGKSAIDAVASFAGSYSIGLLITSKVYKSGAYSAKEAAIIATGFSTVSATFMLIVAKTLDLTELWGVFFFGSLFVTFLVTIITVRLPPLRHLNNDSTVDETNIEYSEPLLVRSFRNGLKVANHAESLSTLIYANIQGGVVMSTRVVPSILSVGLLGLLIAKYTPVFDIIGLVLWPVVWLFEGEQALEISAIISSGLAEMFLPALQGSNFAIETRYVIGLVSISSILFLSASIPCILGSGIPISLGQMLIVWLQRTLLSIPIAYFMVYVFGIS
ncbi:nucleoside recognition domain-containing protein [Alteromonas mediterranea U7]|nr:nucleoside recognition domain-containing protein [Alteromonas mediterranea U7]AGP92996.1 nucleoside recognition domain-containing protein [Alteromonas mediterranea U8]